MDLHNNDIDEDMLIEQLKCCDTDEDMLNFIEIDEMKEIKMTLDYENLYYKMKKKMLLSMKIIKKMVENNE